MATNILIASGLLEKMPEVDGSFHMIVTSDCMVRAALIGSKVTDVQETQSTNLVELAMRVFYITATENSHEAIVYSNIPEVAAGFKNLKFSINGVEYFSDSTLIGKNTKRKSTEKSTAPKRIAPKTQTEETVSVSMPAPENPAKEDKPKKEEIKNNTENSAPVKTTRRRSTKKETTANGLDGLSEEMKNVVIESIKDASDKSIGLPLQIQMKLALAGIDDPDGIALKAAQENYDRLKKDFLGK